MKPICFVVIILICSEITSSYSNRLASNGVQLVGNNNKLLLLGTLVVWAFPAVISSAKVASKQEQNDKARQGSVTVSKNTGKKTTKVKVSFENEQDDEKDQASLKDIVTLVNGPEMDPMQCFPKALCGVSSEVARISNRKKNILITDYLLLMRAISRHPEVVNQVLEAKEKGVALPSGDDPQSDKTPSTAEDDTEDDADKSGSDEEQTDKNESDEEEDDEDDDDDEEDDEPQGDKGRTPLVIPRSKKKKAKIPQNEEEFNKYHLIEKAQMEALYKDTINKESEDDNWWNFGDSPTSNSKTSWWRSRPPPSYDGQEFYSSELKKEPYLRSEPFALPRPTPFGHGPPKLESQEPYYRTEPFSVPRPTGPSYLFGHGSSSSERPGLFGRSEPFSISGPSRSEYGYGGTASSYEHQQGSGPYSRSEPYGPGHSSYGYGPMSSSEHKKGRKPYSRSENFDFDTTAPPRPPDFGQFADTTMTNTGGGGITSFMSKLFGFGSGSGGGMFDGDNFYDGMARDLALSPASDIPGTAGIAETKEILETAMAIGREFDRPSKCNEIFNACQFDYTELLYMIDDLRHSLRRKAKNDKVHHEESKKSTTSKSSSKGKGKQTTKSKTSLKSKGSKDKKSKPKNPSKKVSNKRRKSRLPPTNSNESLERYVIPVKPYSRPSAFGQGMPEFSFSNIFSWLGR